MQLGLGLLSLCLISTALFWVAVISRVPELPSPPNATASAASLSFSNNETTTSRVPSKAEPSLHLLSSAEASSLSNSSSTDFQCDTISGQCFPELLVPIDLVYTWVNGSDPEHIKLRRTLDRNRTGSGGVSEAQVDDSAASQRFRDTNELLFSIRSVETYVPWVRHIFVVTNGQLPSWLNTSHPKVTVVRHSDIFANSSHLPTFNSAAIEMHLHRIPGLSENFIYCNDDVFFLSPLSVADFWTSREGLKIYTAWMIPSCNPSAFRQHGSYAKALCSTNKLLNNRFGVNNRRKTIAHFPFLLSKRGIESLRESYPNQLENTAAHRFRSEDDVQFAFLYYHTLLSLTKPFENVSELFSAVDTDRNGVLCDSELTRFVYQIRQIRPSSFRTALDSALKEFGRCLVPSIPVQVTLNQFTNCVVSALPPVQEALRAIRVPAMRVTVLDVSTLGSFISLQTEQSMKAVSDTLQRPSKGWKILCVNDDLAAGEESIRQSFQSTLHQRYPSKSGFERLDVPFLLSNVSTG